MCATIPLQAAWTSCWMQATGRRRTRCCVTSWRRAGCWRVRCGALSGAVLRMPCKQWLGLAGIGLAHRLQMSGSCTPRCTHPFPCPCWPLCRRAGPPGCGAGPAGAALRRCECGGRRGRLGGGRRRLLGLPLPQGGLIEYIALLESAEIEQWSRDLRQATKRELYLLAHPSTSSTIHRSLACLLLLPCRSCMAPWAAAARRQPPRCPSQSAWRRRAAWQPCCRMRRHAGAWAAQRPRRSSCGGWTAGPAAAPCSRRCTPACQVGRGQVELAFAVE